MVRSRHRFRERDYTRPPARRVPRQLDRESRVRRYAASLRLAPSVAVLACSWALVLVLWALAIVRAFGSVLFLLFLVTAAWATVLAAVGLARGTEPERAVRRCLLVTLLFAVPVTFSLRVVDSFNLVKGTVLVLGALGLVMAFAIEALRTGRMPRCPSGLGWPVLALVVWLLGASLAGVSPRFSTIGGYASRDGLASTLAYATVFVAVVDAFEVRHLRRLLSVLWFAAGGSVAFYGFLQLVEQVTNERVNLDWFNWSPASFPPDTIWSTLGNPNHLGGFVAILLPVGLSIVITERGPMKRATSVLLAIVFFAELVYSGSAGAWLGSLVGILVTAAMLAPELRSHLTTAVAGMLGLTVVALAVAALAGPTKDVGGQLSGAFRLGGASSANQRLGYWRAAAGMAGVRPVTGWGADTYELEFSRFQDRPFVEHNGATSNVNGPHNVFLVQLVSGGVPALAAFVAILVMASHRAAWTWRRLRRAERAGEDICGVPPGHLRFLLAGVTGGFAAYVVQGSFNVQQVALAFLFWALLGMLGLVSLAVGAPDSACPGRVVLRSVIAGDKAVRAVAPILQTRWLRVAAMAGCGIAGLILSVMVTGPYRADGRFFTGSRWQVTADSLEKSDPGSARFALVRARTSFEEASRRNPWEANYALSLARVNSILARSEPQDAAQARVRLSLLRQARVGFEDALDLNAGSFRTLQTYAELLIRIVEVDPSDRGALDAAKEALREAVRANPYDDRSSALLATLLEHDGRLDEAASVLDRGLAKIPSSADLLRRAARLHDKMGDTPGAEALWQRLLLVSPDDAEASKALVLP